MPTDRAIERANQITGQYGGNTQTTAGAISSRPSAIPSTQGSTVQLSTPAAQTPPQSSTQRVGTQTALARADAIFSQYGERAAAARQQPVTSHALQNGGLVDRSSVSAGEQLYQQRQQEQTQARSSFGQALLGLLGNAAIMGNSAYLPTSMQTDLARQQMDYANQMRDAYTTARQAGKATDWEGRQDLIDEYRRLERTISNSMSPQNQANIQRRNEIRAQLEAGDLAAGNGRRDYSFSDTTSHLFGGTAKNIAGSLMNAGVTLGDALARGQAYSYSTDQFLVDQMLGVDSSAMQQAKIDAYNSEESRAMWDRMYQAADNVSDSAAQDIQTIKNGASLLGQVGVDIAENALEMGFDAGVAYFTGGSSLIPMFARTFGSSTQEARREGATLDQQLGYGFTKATIEVATEKMFDGVAKIYGAGAADAVTEELIRKLASTDTGRTCLRMIAGAAGEGIEEVVSDLLAPMAERIYKDESLRELYGQVELSDVLYDFFIGATIGGLGGGVSLVNGQNRAANAELRARDAGAADLLGTATDAELTQLRDAAGQALEVLELDEETQVQLRILQTAADAELRERGVNNETTTYNNEITTYNNENAAPDNGSGALNNDVTGGNTNVENQAQTEQGLLGQTQTVPPAGEQAGRTGEADTAAAGPAAGAETTQSDTAGAEAPGGSGGRHADPSFRGESERVVTSPAERRERAAEQGRRAAARQSLGNALWERGEITLQSAQDLGITSGTETQDLKVFPQESYDEEMQDVANWVASEYGLSVTFVSGVIRVNTPSGVGRVRGVYTGSGIILQADNRNESITSLARHEVFHDEAARDAGLVEEVRRELVEQYSPEEMRQILRGYIINLRGEINVDENTDMDHLDEAAMQIFEEVCADAAGGINAFGLGAYQYENTVNRVRQERAALREQANGDRETRGPPQQRMSYGGEMAWDADIPALDVAIDMEQEGSDPETIRRDTGWFRGMDGQWRFEIDDSEMGLREGWKDGLEKQHSEEGMKLSDVIEHENLFRQYPELANIDVAFDIISESQTLGRYQAPMGEDRAYNRPGHISLNERLLQESNRGELLDTLIHELQHAIQNREGFTRGSNPGAWQRRIDNGYDNRMPAAKQAARQAKEKMQQFLRNEPEYYRDMIELMNDVPTGPRGAIDWDTLEQIEDDPQEWQDWDARRDAMEEKYGDRIFHFMYLYDDLNGTGKKRRDAQDLYFNTAGEIEARDTEYRRSWDRERRQETPPRRAGEYTVFAEEGDESFSIKFPTYTEEQMERNSANLQSMDIVKELTGNEFSDHSKTLRENVLEFFNSLGNNVYSEEFGDVALTPSSVRSDIRHGMTREKNIAYAALPEVIQNGTVIYTIDKGFSLERIVTAAPITIGGQKYYMAVMLQRNPTSQRLYAHDVVIEKEPTPKAGGHLSTNKAVRDGDKLFITDILQNALAVKSEEAGGHDDSMRYSMDDSERQAIEQEAVDRFGTTEDFAEAGYILSDGRMLRFTNDNHAGERDYDHRAIGTIYGANIDLSKNHGFSEDAGQYLERFVESGGIRFEAGEPDLDMDAGMQLSSTAPLTREQEQRIRDFVGWMLERENTYIPDEYSLYSKPLALHIEFGGDADMAVFTKPSDMDTWGVKHLDYEGGQINADRIINDIRRYYQTGEISRPSDLARFHYSADDSNLPGTIWGDSDETYVNDTEPVQFRWAIVPLESLVISNDTSGSVNPAYPAELQPRNRGRQASQLQMQRISQNINPRQLEDSPNAQNGAPIIRSDGVVIGGNIRSMALTDAYNKGRADAYRDYVRDRAARKFGLDTAELPEHPVLVRVAEDVSDWAKLARDLNTSTIASYSATERAMADAARMDSRIMAMLNPDEDGNINTTANRDFIQSFVSNVIPDNERGAAITGSGLLSQDGLERAEYAIFAAAYQDAELMQRMSESLDNDMKNVTNGLLDIAPKVMQYQAAVDAGQMYDTRATENLLAAVRLYTEAKRGGMTVEERTANQSLTDDYSDEIIYTARIIEKFKRSAKQIRTFFNGLYDEIESYGDPNQLNFFGEDESHSYRDALEGAIRRYERATETELPSLGDWGAGWYEAADRGNEAEAADAVYESPDPGGGESDGGSAGGEVEEIPWDASPLPPPPGTETETVQEQQATDEPRQRDLERMAKRREREQQKQQKKIKRQRPKFPNHPEYDPLEPYKNSSDPVKEFIKASQARAAAAKAERMMQADKRSFTGSPALQKLGVHIQNSVGNYAHVDQLLARERAAYQLRKTIRQREAKLNATAKEKAFAAGMAAGVYTAEDIPANMNRAKLEELADYYWAEKSVASDMIAQRRKDINLGLDEQMDELLKDSDLYKVPAAVVMNYRTPERLCKTIWGDEHGQAIYDAIFRPVSVNEAEKTRFINRMFDEVRTFEGSDGQRSELNRDERMLVQQVLEGRAVAELVASMEMHEAVENAAQNIRNGESSLDNAREFGLNEEEQGIAEQYARWLMTKEVYDSGNFDAVKIDNAVKKYSEMYDSMYDAINDFLVAHGYDPIGFIKGYAPHMQMNEDLNLFAGYLDRLGFNTNVTRLPASIAGRTANLKPNKRWNPYFLQRTGDMTDFDIAKGFQSYVNYLSDVLYHTDDIMRIRAMSRYYRRTFAPDEIRETLDWVHHNEQASMEVKEDMLKSRGIIARDSQLSPRDIQATFDEWVDKQYESVENMTKYSDYVSYLDNYANILAGKQSSIDRGAEALLGRESLTWGNKLVNSFQRTQVAGSFSSALNQSAQLPQIKAELGSKYTAKAIADFVSGAARKGAWAQESDFLTGKRGVDMLVTDAFDMVMDKAFMPATFVDSLMSTIAVRGKYLQQIDAGKSHEEAMRAADDFGKGIMGSRAKGEKPVGFQSKRPVVQMLNMFQIEALNSWEHLSQDLPADFRAIEKQSGTKAAATALASVMVKMLLSAFLLNRLGEEIYGGTPAPFDLIGLSANFIASGKGLTTNQWLKTVIDNGMEKLTGDRLLGTDPDAMREGFAWEDALEDTGYNISNDIPFFRNIAGLMGWGDQTLPLPLMGAGKDLKYLLSDIKSDISEGRFSAETGMDLLRIMNQALPGGRQLTKTVEGLQLMQQGGRYVNDRLYYPVENSMGNWIKALLFGRSSLYESDAYYAGNDSSLSRKQTEMYRELVRNGADGLTLYRTIQDYKAIAGNDDLGSYEKGRQEREAITNADLTDEQRLALYRGMSTNNEGRAEDFEEIMETGLTWADTVKAYDKWAELNANEDISKTEKAEAYAAWVERQGYDDTERDAVRDHFKFWQSIPIENTKVDKFAGAGMDADTAEQLSETLQNLQPLPGKTSVTDLQKYQAIADSGLSVEDQWAAIIAQTNPSYTSTLDKIEIYRQQGITPAVWTASKEAMYAADDAGNNNDSTDQKEAKAALDGMNIPDWQKAILWQTTNKSWKPNKNPYDREIGQAIYDQMHGGGTASVNNSTTYTLPNGASFTISPDSTATSDNPGGLELGTWGSNSYTTASGATFNIPRG